MNDRLGGRYTPTRRIGKGGYGDVWLAHDDKEGRDVAIKILSVGDRSRSTAKNKLERFRREAISMAKIQHPNAVAIFDVGAIPEKQELFLVMELLVGRNLWEELELNGPLRPDRCLRRFIDALDGLEAAHAVGVIHKDLKPANLFLNNVGTAMEQMKVIDFGIARMESLTKLTGTGRMAGSPRYLAPEYIMGEEVTPAIDVYQIALILVEALSGSPCIPREQKFFEICQAHILGQLEIPPSLLNSELGPILVRALKRHPSERYASAREFAHALSLVNPDSVPEFDLEETVQMPAPRFDDTMPDSEPSMTAMIEELRVEEGKTSRYAAIGRPAVPRNAPPPSPVASKAPASPKASPRDPATKRMLWLVWIAAATLLAVVAAVAAIQMDRASRAAPSPAVEAGPPNDDK